MTSTNTQGMSEERQECIACQVTCPVYRYQTGQLEDTIRRLRQREVILQHDIVVRDRMITDLKAQLGWTQEELQSEIRHPLGAYEHPLPSFLAKAPESDHGEYARGVRVP